jgi:RNA polymerase sigma factor (sigma-70 family)
MTRTSHGDDDESRRPSRKPAEGDASTSASESEGREDSGPASSPIGDFSDSLVWLEGARRGDRELRERLFTRYYERLVRIVRVRMGSSLARRIPPEQVVNDTLLVAARKLSDFEPRNHGAFFAWLMAIADRKVKDARRSEAARPRPEPIFDQAHAQPGPATMARQRELKEIYDACVAELADEPRELILQRDYFECSWEEIAATTGRPNAHATMEAYRRARIKLATIVARRLGDGTG